MSFSISCQRTFGCEFETVSSLTSPLTSAIHAVCDAYSIPYSSVYREAHLSAHCVRLPDGRVWKAERDGSLSHGGAEIVTPPLTTADLPMVRKVLYHLRQNGHTVDSSCGGHIHVGAADFDAASLRRLVNLFFSKQDLLTASNGTQSDRLHGGYAEALDARLIEALNKAKPDSLQKFAQIWYGNATWSSGWMPCERWLDHAEEHYCSARYRALNLHPFFDPNRPNTVEFRFFEGTLDYSQVEANVLLALSMVEMAAASKSASPKVAPTQQENPRYAFRCFLLRLGFIGDEFTSARKVLLNRLLGDTAWLRGKDSYESYHAQVANRRAQPTA